MNILLLLLTPIYLALVFYKSYSGVDFASILLILLLMLGFYMPIQIITSEKKLDITYYDVYSDPNIQITISYVFGFLVMGIITMITFIIYPPAGFVTGFIMYAFWWQISNNIFIILKESGIINKIKILVTLLITIIIGVLYYITSLDINFNYFNKIEALLLIFYIAGSIFITSFILIPHFALYVLKNSRSFSFLFSQAGISTVVIPVLLALLFSSIVIVRWLSEIVLTFDPYIWSYISLATFLLFSAMGALFQFRLFFSFFIESELIVKRISYISFLIFYITLGASISIMDRLDDTTKSIESFQKNINILSDHMGGKNLYKIEQDKIAKQKAQEELEKKLAIEKKNIDDRIKKNSENYKLATVKHEEAKKVDITKQLNMIENDCYSISAISNPAKEIKVKAVELCSDAIQYINNPTVELQKIAIKSDGSSIQFIKKPTEEIMMISVEQDPMNLDLIASPTQKVQKKAVELKPLAIKFIEKPSEELQIIAVTKSKMAYYYIKNPTDKVKKLAGVQ